MRDHTHTHTHTHTTLLASQHLGEGVGVGVGVGVERETLITRMVTTWAPFIIRVFLLSVFYEKSGEW